MKVNASLKLTFLLSLLLIQSTKQNFLQFDAKRNCPNTPLTPLGVLISLADTEYAKYSSTLTQEEREPYEEILSLKRSFATTMSYIPQSFAPEKRRILGCINLFGCNFCNYCHLPNHFCSFLSFYEIRSQKMCRSQKSFRS